jgi:hypothetical protein
MNPELEELFNEWEKEELEELEYHETTKIYNSVVSDQEAFNIGALCVYLNLMTFCMRFIVDYVHQYNMNKYKNECYYEYKYKNEYKYKYKNEYYYEYKYKNEYKIEKVKYSINEID